MRHILLVAMAVLLLAGQMEAKIVNRTVTYKHGDTTLHGYLVYDDSIPGKRPGVLIFPEWWGLTQFPKDKAEQLARMGYVALAADMHGEGWTTSDPQEAARRAGQFTPQLLRERARAALQVLQRQEQADADRIAAIGFCLGGAVAQHLAYSGADIDAAVSFHGSPVTPSAEEAERTTAQILFLTGGDDPMVPPDKVAALWQGLQRTGITWQIVVYSGAKHSFTNPEADRISRQYNMQGVGYNAAADQRSWDDMQQLFREVFRAPPAGQSQPMGQMTR